MPTTFQKTDPRLTLESGAKFLVLGNRPLLGRVETNGVWDVWVDDRRFDVDEDWPDWEWAIPSELAWKTGDPRKWVYKTAYFLVQRNGWFAYAEIETKYGPICNVGGQRLRENEPWPEDWGWIQLSKIVNPGQESIHPSVPITELRRKRFPMISQEEIRKRWEEDAALDQEAFDALDRLAQGTHVICPTCEGHGFVNAPPNDRECPDCKGAKMIKRSD